MLALQTQTLLNFIIFLKNRNFILFWTVVAAGLWFPVRFESHMMPYPVRLSPACHLGLSSHSNRGSSCEQPCAILAGPTGKGYLLNNY